MKVVVSWRRRRAEFRYPVAPAPSASRRDVPRTAVLAPWFAPRGNMRMFDPRRLERWLEELERFAPQAIAATWEQFQELADSLGSIKPTHAIIVLHRVSGLHLLEAEDRARLWGRFRVPVFEQVIGPRGELLAAECEAHDGLHIESSWENRSVPVNNNACACGRKAPRLMSTLTAEPLGTPAAGAR